MNYFEEKIRGYLKEINTFLPEDNSLVKIKLINSVLAYCCGLVDGVATFAFFKDGTEWVGTTGKKLKDELKEITEAKDKIIKELS